MIVVIDTSVWISALQFGHAGSTPLQAVERALRRDTLATAPEINAEIRKVLVVKFLWSSDHARRIVAAYFKKAIHIEISGALRVWRDPNDDMVLECAMLAGAQVIVSGDKDLLVLGAYKGIRILPPAGYLAMSS